jgi:site-specific recombinase XerD
MQGGSPMLQNNITNFLQYCKNSNFAERSIESLTHRLNEFNHFINSIPARAFKDINFELLSRFIADYNAPSPSVKKMRIWTLRNFFHYLKLEGLINDNIAARLPYPKIEKKVPHFLTIAEFNRILNHFANKASSQTGLRNLVIIALLGILGLRTATIEALNVADIDLTESRIWITQKGFLGQFKKELPLPQTLCQLLTQYISQLDESQKPLFVSTRNKRLARRSVQGIFYNTARIAGVHKKLHPHLFRHTAGTQLNQVAGMEITQFVLGHQNQQNTHQYAHLNPDIYAERMKNHPYMTFEL